MKKSVKLRTTLLMCVALIASVFVFAFTTQTSTVKVNADTSIFVSQDIYIRTKTQNSDIAGIRFTTTVDLTNSDISSDAEFGLIVAKTDSLGGKALNFDLENFNAVASKIPAGVFVTKTETNLVYNIVINNIPESDYGVNLTAVPYVIDGETTVVASEGRTCSIAEVASVLISKGVEGADKLVAYVDGVTDENSLVVDATALTLVEGETADLEVSVAPNYLVPTYASDNSEIATVKNGVITAVKAGTANITVSLGSIVKTVFVTVEEPITPDANDENALGHLYATGVTRWKGSTTTAEIVTYESTSLSRPAGVEGDTLIKYVHTNPGNTKLNSVPLRYSNGNWSIAFNEEQKALDFSKAVLSFYIYNASSATLPVHYGYNIGSYSNSSATNYGTTNAPAGQWTKVEVDLAVYNIDVTKSYEMFMFVGGNDIAVDANVEYYIDNVTFYEKAVVDANDEEAVKHLVPGGVKWVGSNTTAEILSYSTLSGISKPEGVEGDTLIKYVHTNPGNTKINSVPLRYSSGTYAFNEEQKALDFSKAVMSFYIYNETAKDLPVYYGSVWGAYPNNAAANKGSTTAKAGQWTKVEVDLAAFSINVNSSYELYIFVGSDDRTPADVTFYIDNVTFYKKAVVDANDENALGHLFETGVTRWKGSTTTAEIVTYESTSLSRPAGVEGDTLIKYVHTNPGNTKLNSVPLRYSNGNWSIAFNEEQKALDFSKTILSFYIYNASSVAFSIHYGYNIASYANSANYGTTNAPAGQWTKVEVDLSVYNINASGSYEMFMFIHGDIAMDANVEYYIDNVTFYEVNA